MKKQPFILIGLLMASLYSSAQITFQKTYGDTTLTGDASVWAVLQTADGGYIISGYTTLLGAGNSDMYFIKTNSTGDTLWTRTYGGSNIDNAGNVIQTPDGGYLASGTTYNTGTGQRTACLIKMDADGDTLWTRTYGVQTEGFSVILTTDGGYMLTGAAPGAGNNDVYLVKTDANGDTLWTRAYGGVSGEAARSVYQTTDGGYITAGTTYTFGAGGSDVYLVRTDSTGNLMWSKTFGGSNLDDGYIVQQTSDGGFIVSATTSSYGSGDYDAWLIKTDSAGTAIWTRTYGGSNGESGNWVQQTSDGGYILAGYCFSFSNGPSDMYLVKTNANGDTLWTRVYGGANYDFGSCVRQTSDGGYVLVGNALSFGGASPIYYMVKTDALGNSHCNEKGTSTINLFVNQPVNNPLTIVSCPAPVIGNVALLPGTGQNALPLCLAIGINENPPGHTITVSPNPVTGNLTVIFKQTIAKGNVQILNTMGGCVLSNNINNKSEKEINLKNIPGGIYFVKVFDGEKYFCKKIIIEQN